MSGKPKRKQGRPVVGTEPQYDAALLERLLVHGEFVAGERDRIEHWYPSFGELAERFGISKSTVHRFAKRHRCVERRASPDGASPRVEADARDEQPVSEEDGSRAPQQTSRPMLPSVRRIFTAWVEAVERGEIQVANAGEIEKMMRIAADLDAEAQMRALIPEGVPTLDQLQDLYEARMAAYEASSPGERGEIPIGIPGCDVVYDAAPSEDGEGPLEGDADE